MNQNESVPGIEHVEDLIREVSTSMNKLSSSIRDLTSRADKQQRWSNGKWMILLPWISLNTCSIIYLMYFK